MDRIDADVCIVGAGYAGLTAARRLHQAGVSIVVLEALVGVLLAGTGALLRSVRHTK